MCSCLGMDKRPRVYYMYKIQVHVYDLFQERPFSCHRCQLFIRSKTFCRSISRDKPFLLLQVVCYRRVHTTPFAQKIRTERYNVRRVQMCILLAVTGYIHIRVHIVQERGVYSHDSMIP